MIIKKTYIDRRLGGLRMYKIESYYLFGFIPLYIKETEL